MGKRLIRNIRKVFLILWKDFVLDAGQELGESDQELNYDLKNKGLAASIYNDFYVFKCSFKGLF